MRVSVALCTYNGARYLPELLASLAAQTRPPDELVVCDDRSADDTRGVVGRFAATAPFAVSWVENPVNLGSTPNFDQAIRRCSGDVIFLCDQDDVWLPQKIERFVAPFEGDPAVALVASDLEITGANGEPLNRRVWAEIPFPPAAQAAVMAGGGVEQLVRFNTITGAATAFRSSLVDLICPIPPEWVHDGWVALLAAATGRVVLQDTPSVRYRSHDTQQIGSEPLSLARQIRTARAMDAAYFARTAACFAAAADRLAGSPQRLVRPNTLALLRAKAAFARTQQRMREGWRVGRVWPALAGLARGHYFRLGRGWKGFAADLLL